MSSDNNVFSNQYLNGWLEKDILFIVYKDEAIVDLNAAKQILEDRLNFIGGKSYLTFVDVRKARYWTREAREFQATKENNIGIKAAAMLIDSSVQNIIINFYLTLNKPNVPQKAFTNREEALKWLEQFK